MRRVGWLLIALLLVAGACADSDRPEASSTDNSAGTSPTSSPSPTADDLPADYQGYTSDQYADGRNWLCHPDDADENICERDLTATVVHPDGTSEIQPHEKATDPPIDCFYVYPTISTDPGLNSDLSPSDQEEIRAAVNQVARLSSTCRIYAPVYRQLTIGSLLSRMSGEEIDQGEMEAARDMAYGDVVDAWKQYLANENDGRGVILIGHSQGASLLSKLVAEEIDDEPALRDRLVAAYLIGTTVGVPEGQDVGGDYDNVPLCRAPEQTGCIVTYASFPASEPPPDDSFFGQSETPGLVAGCTNPAALDGGSATMIPYFTAEESQQVLAAGAPIDTPWVSIRDTLTAECVDRTGHMVLEVTVSGDPTDTRDRVLRGGLPANWGSHLADMNLAMGNFQMLAAAEAAAFTG